VWLIESRKPTFPEGIITTPETADKKILFPKICPGNPDLKKKVPEKKKLQFCRDDSKVSPRLCLSFPDDRKEGTKADLDSDSF
jgi:hypothetical protein